MRTLLDTAIVKTQKRLNMITCVYTSNIPRRDFQRAKNELDDYQYEYEIFMN